MITTKVGNNPRYEKFWSYGLAILIPLIAFLPLAGSLGFYDDDWFAVWGGVTHGSSMIREMHLVDRPFEGIIYGFHYNLLGKSPLSWQLYVDFLRVITSVCTLWAFRKLWPEQKLGAAIGALLMVVFPGFIMQPNVHTFSNHIFGYTAATLSIALTVASLFQKDKFLKITLISLSLIFELVNFLMLEYMVGIEAIRYLFIWLIISRDKNEPLSKSINRFIRSSVIYLLPLLSFLGWRFFFFQPGRRVQDPGLILNSYLQSPLRTIIIKALGLFQDFFETVFASLFVHSYSLLRDASTGDLLSGLFFAFTGVFFFFCYWYLFHRQAAIDPITERNWGRIVMWAGIFGVLGALAPVTVANREVILLHSFSRYTIHAAYGVALIWMGWLFYAFRPHIRLVVFLFILGLSIMIQYQNAVAFKVDWEHQKDLWWQLTWRAPDLQPDTVLVIVPSEKTSYTEGYEIWGPANLIYSPDNEIHVVGQVLSADVLIRILRGSIDSKIVRGVVEINRDYDNTLLAAFSNNLSCLHVVDGSQIELGPDTPPIVMLAAPKSNIEQVITRGESHTLPGDIFGEEPEHSWCYYYQKINLARQQEDWELAASLADESLSKDFKPLERIEWMAVFEAYANADRVKDANEIAKIIRDDKGVEYLLCSQLKNAPEAAGYNYDFIYETLCGK